MLLTLRKLYADFPWVYDALYPVIYDYAKDFSCYDSLLQATRARRVLDLGCGTGLLARYLVDAGYEYTGVDISPAMLALARRRIASAHFILGDMRDLASLRSVEAGAFDAIICTGRAFAHLTADEEVLACLHVVAGLLRPGGLFACDVIDAGRVVADPVQRVTQATVVGEREFQREFVHARAPGAGTTLYTTTRWRILEHERLIAEFDDEICHRAYLPGELAGFLSASGLGGNFACAALPHLPSVLLASAYKVET